MVLIRGLPKLRTFKCSVTKNYIAWLPWHYYYKMLKELLQQNAYRQFYNILKSNSKQQSHNNSSFHKTYCNHNFSWIQYRQFCSAVQNVKNQPNKIITILQSKKFETENKFDAKSFFDSVCEHKELSFVEWDLFKEQMLNSRLFTTVSFSGSVMNNLLSKNNYFLALSFMKYLEMKNQQPNIFTLTTFMRLCGQNINECGESDIINMYNKAKNNLKIMDSTLMINVVCALSATSHWKEGYKIYMESEFHPSCARNSLACAAFRNHNFEVAEQLINENEDLDNEVYIEWLNAISSIHLTNPKESSSLLNKLLQFLHSKEIIVSHEVAKLISFYFESLENEDWKGTFIVMSKEKACRHCNQPLQLLEININQHQLLQEAILSQVMKGSDVFINTSPQELQNFMEFIKSTAPYDIVIDGLNIGYFVPKDTSKSERAHRLFLVVEHFAKNKGMKALVLGRKHLKTWPVRFMEPISRMAKIFYVDNISKDDPFLLYAALMSGPKTMILTKDLLRNHKFWLQDPLLGIYFEHWRKSHQIFLTTVTPAGRVIYQNPLPYSIVTQGSMESGWHIPYALPDDKPKSVYDFHKNWLCITRKL